jgi:DNA modification methylase
LSIQVPQVEYLSPSELKVDGQNPNRMKPKQLAALEECITKYGFIVPVVTNKDLLIADGEQRWTIAQKLQLPKIPVIRLPIKDVDRRTLRQVLNKLRGEHELLGDAAEFERIIQAGGEEDLKLLLSLSSGDIEQYMRILHEDKAETFIIPKIETVKTQIKPGDIFQLGKHRLMCGDATNLKNALQLLNGESVDMVFTDPPYGINYLPETKELRKLGHLAGDGDYRQAPREFPVMRDSLPIIAQICKPGSPIYYCTGWQEIGLITDTLRANGCHVYSVLVWDRITPRFRGHQDFIPVNEFIVYAWRTGHKRYINNSLKNVKSSLQLMTIWRFKTMRAQAMTHTTEKPIELPKNAILLSSPKGGIIADLFGGSGSTLIACEQTERICYMMDIDARYCQVIIDRWESYTGQKAIMVSEQKVDSGA